VLYPFIFEYDAKTCWRLGSAFLNGWIFCPPLF
jgi:hypothetical protein